MKFKNLNKLFTLVTPNCLKYILTKHSRTATLGFVNENICIGDSNGSKSSQGPVLHSYIWIAYRWEIL
jgi:hypothetical protein